MTTACTPWHTREGFTSPWNHDPGAREQLAFPESVRRFRHPHGLRGLRGRSPRDEQRVRDGQGDRVALRVRLFPETELPAGEYVPAAAIETHLRGLHRRYPAEVLATYQAIPGGRETTRGMPGPEVAYHGSARSGSCSSIVAAQAAMLAVQRATTASIAHPFVDPRTHESRPKPPSRVMRFGTPR